MIERTEMCFGMKPKCLAADTAYGAAQMLAWLVKEKGIEPHIPVFDKSARKDGTLSRADFTFDCRAKHLRVPTRQTPDHYRSRASEPNLVLPCEQV